MEEVLDVYHRPADPTRPLMCLDETSRQLLDDVRPPLSAYDAKDPILARFLELNLEQARHH